VGRGFFISFFSLTIKNNSILFQKLLAFIIIAVNLIVETNNKGEENERLHSNNDRYDPKG